MAKARRNPIGAPAVQGTRVAYVGSGDHTHVIHPGKMKAICNSGKNAGKVGKLGDRRGGPQTITPSNANFVTCYRCQKLMSLNMDEGRLPWQGRNEA